MYPSWSGIHVDQAALRFTDLLVFSVMNKRPTSGLVGQP